MAESSTDFGFPRGKAEPIILPQSEPISKIEPKIKFFFNTTAPLLITYTPSIEFTGLENLMEKITNAEKVDKIRVFIIVHGFLNDGDAEWMTNIKDEILNYEGEKRHNDLLIVGLLCWKNGCGNLLEYAQACANTKAGGAWLGKFVKILRKSVKKPLEIWGIGHSLGSHFLGSAGRFEKIGEGKGTLFNRITGLDPAGLGFENNFPDKMLCKDDAAFVDVIHTDGYEDKTTRSKPSGDLNNFI